MALTSGTKLVSYEIIAPLGAGGMGEVYRARDTRLNREVAIKVLPELFLNDAERLARFTREARTLASLNHPNIAQIYGLEESGGVRALVMELVEGEDLTVHIARGPMPLAEVLPIARQIAEALEAAHDLGIVHRDLKPANIKIRADGAVKVLDFGLAKAITPAITSSTGSASADSPTLTARATQLGVILGTVAYMSPEQAKGRAVDRRADIWAFGAVLYEMLTGERAFRGDDTTETLASVLKDNPSYASLPPQVSPRLRRLLERCLDRDVKERLRDIGEARVEIAKIQSGVPETSSVHAASKSDARPANPWIVRAAIASAILVAAAAAGWLGRRSSAPEPPWSEFTQLTDASNEETGPSISPDGTSFAYASKARGSWDIYVQRVGGRNPILVAGDPARDEVWPAFSPDGKQIAFSLGGGNGGIFVVGATGESVRRVTDFGSNPAWSPNGQHIVFCTREVVSPYDTTPGGGMWTVDVNNGTPAKIDDGEVFQPAWSPSGARIAFWQNVNGQRDLATIPRSGGERVMVTSDPALDWAPVWSPDGRFLYFASDRGGSMGIWRIALDEASGRPSGAPEPIAAGADVAMDLPHLSADGSSLIFRSMIQSTNPGAIAFDPKTETAGNVRLLQERTGHLVPTDVSPDGQWIALSSTLERQQDIFIIHPDGSGLLRLTDDLARDWFPRFTPDGSALTFFSNKGGVYDGWSIRLDGSNRTRLTEFPNREVNYTMFAPDARRIMTVVDGKSILIGAAPWPLTARTVTEIRNPAVGGGTLFPSYWSRDGRWLSGSIELPSGKIGGNALYDVVANTVRQLSDDADGIELAWMPGDTRVVYFTTGGKLVIQDVASLKRHEIPVKLPFPPDAARHIKASPDGRTLYYGARQVEANIWKVERPAATRR